MASGTANASSRKRGSVDSGNHGKGMHYVLCKCMQQSRLGFARSVFIAPSNIYCLFSVEEHSEATPQKQARQGPSTVPCLRKWTT